MLLIFLVFTHPSENENAFAKVCIAMYPRKDKLTQAEDEQISLVQFSFYAYEEDMSNVAAPVGDN